MIAMSPRDRVAMLRILGLTLTPTPDGRLLVEGPVSVIHKARPTLTIHRDALIAYLRAEHPPALRTVA
jgi:hypothetical protein